MSGDDLEITPRLDEDGRQRWGESEFRDALGYIGTRLGLSGTYHLVNDVIPAFNRLLDTKPDDLPRILAQLQYALEKAPDVERTMARLFGQLRKLEKRWRESQKDGAE